MLTLSGCGQVNDVVGGMGFCITDDDLERKEAEDELENAL
jgi:hypothetical protein